MPLATMIHDPAVGIEGIDVLLGAMTWEARRVALGRLGRRDQRALYQKAAAAAPLGMADFASASALTEVRHWGRNTLPLPPFLRRFEKRFCQPADGSDRRFGFNEGASRPWIGPGYFVARPVGDTAGWAERGSVVVDYFQVPDGPVVASWPKVVPNDVGLQFLVYRGTRDFMRRVGAGVTIGAAYKGEQALDHYFVLLRWPDEG